jgi:TetR/AcrR family transcriptional regulator
MGKKSVITQRKIIDSARELFLERGFDGVKMQELADRAGVNKGLLHHYFHNKQCLFDEVFTQAIDQLFSKIEVNLLMKTSIEVRLSSIVDTYFDMLLANPKLPIFVFFELNRNPEKIHSLFKTDKLNGIVKGLKMHDKRMNEKKAIHIFLTIASLSVFPFMAKPIVMKMVKNEKNFTRVIEERRPIVKSLISNLVKSL